MTHPPDTALRAHASGSTPFTRRLLVEAHLLVCPECAARVGDEASGTSPVPSAADRAVPPPFTEVWAAIERRGERARVDARACPLSVLASLRAPARLRWIRLWPGRARSAVIARDVEGGSVVYLTYYPRGTRYPRHRHVGLEENVILAGGYEDAGRHVEAGDWVIAPPGSDHAPATGPDEECWCLSRVAQPGIRFYGWREWARRLLAPEAANRGSIEDE